LAVIHGVITPLITAILLAASPVQLRSQQKIPFEFNQGVARTSGGWVLSGTNVLARVDDNLKQVVRQQPAIPADWAARGYKHVGDVDVLRGEIYAPYEQPDFSLGRQATARYDAKTLQFLGAVEVPQHENSFVAIDSANGTAYSMDRFDGDSLVRYQLPDWTPLPPLQMSTTLHHTQGGAVARGAVWISTSDDGNNVYRVDIRTGAVTRVATLGKAGEGEGMDATALARGDLHVVRAITGTLDVLLQHLGPPEERATWPLWVVVGVGVPLLAGTTVWYVRNRRRRRPRPT